MANNKIPKIKEREVTSKRRVDRTTMDIALLEYVRCGESAWQASKITALHHTTIQRAWDRLSENDKIVYRERAGVIANAVEDAIISQEVAVITDVTSKLQEIGGLALNELRSRLNDDLRRMDMKDADLINIATKCLAMAEDNMRVKEEQKKNVTVNVAQMFNILDNSIQDNLQKSSMKYED